MKAYIDGIAYYLPSTVRENPDGRMRKKTGIERRHVASVDETAADMAVKAAERLFEYISRNQIDYVLFCTQSPDYYLPTTACIIQDRLGLSNACGALDYNHGCTGYIYGLGLAKGLIESGQSKCVLLLTAETYTKYINDEDLSVAPLFGDGAAATLIKAYDTDKEGIYCLEYGTDGAGFQNLIVPVGGMRNPYQSTEVTTNTDKYGNIRTNQNLFMNGSGIMEFALDVVPATVDKILIKTNYTRQDIDYFVFHQANHFMLKSIQKICKLQDRPFYNNIRDYGNTVSSSIPIALCDIMQETSPKTLQKSMLMGFGVGLSWGGCIVDLSKVSVVVALQR
ncbi:3-oxoacyl-ACP synthase III family protein [Anaerovibrio sp.]|uniref:3-oxoacyl-ACP synthase III family protein n=1 Tax=Anaerovibrio sp. TaxID=1872532 RepID=UPI00388FD16C